MVIYLANLDSQEDKDKFTYLYNKYRKRMWYVANKILADEHWAEDVVHDAFIKISKHFEKITSKSRNEIEKLFVIIVKRLAIDALRRKNKIDFIPISDQLLIDENTINDPIEIVISQEQYRRLSDLIFNLDEHYSSVLNLKWGLGYSNKEIAELLDITEDNVRLRLHRGRKKLMAVLREEESHV